MRTVARYRIVCADKAHNGNHHHIERVGVNPSGGRFPSDWLEVTAVRARLRIRQDSFYTFEGSFSAEVTSYDCACGVLTIRSDADASAQDNLDDLDPCR